ncbi:extracellular solute-binding protein [Rathayibacter sp. VKM Ac-2803]|uniref:ABC transporter substrate-binding protein n=1 Tax=unclassified Rathayibacter TaxID=2609250 RepID=UPI00135CC515|nr:MULTISPECIES: sugar ABC transporter substrate-binding protein [unclassified Rathayibacter]MWV48651.1 extracellular solute-binding protein [Rathayibacter sp. VKM Ac-2803]MWV60680.1 extracellular solute-binding protein [Rathayibacter sp. VKM Ac-2754]
MSLRRTPRPLARRRVLLVGAVALASTTVLAGCGAGGGTGASGDADTVIVLVEAGGLVELQPIADKFTEDTGTTVDFVELPYDGLYNRLNSEFSAGSVSFDVAALDAIWLPAFAGAVTPLDDLYTDDVVADLFPSLVEEADVDGSYVGMPAWTNSEILYYRTDLFEDPAQQAAFKAEYGYDLVPPTTWQQYRDAAAFFTQDTDGDGTTDLYGTDVKGAVETEWLATLSQTGETTMVTDTEGAVSLGDAESKEALDFYTSLLPYAPPGAAQLDWAGAQNLFNQGQTAMMRFWAHAYRQIPADAAVAGNVGVAPMIGGEAGPAGVPGAWYLSVAEASEKQEKALEFVQYAYDNNELSAETSLGLASRISVLEKYQDVEGFENYKPLLDTLNSPATLPRPAVAEWQQIVDTVLIPMLQKSVEPGADNQQLLDDAAQQVETLVAK